MRCAPNSTVSGPSVWFCVVVLAGPIAGAIAARASPAAPADWEPLVYVRTWTQSPAFQVTVDPVTSDVFLAMSFSVARFTSDGRLLARWGELAVTQLPGGFGSILSLTAGRDRVVVVDFFNDWIQVFDQSGAFIRGHSPVPSHLRSRRVASDGGRAFVLSGPQPVLSVLDPDVGLCCAAAVGVPGQCDAITAGGGRVYVACRDGIKLFNQGLQAVGEWANPGLPGIRPAIAASARSGHVVIGDQDDDRLQVLDRRGRLVDTISGSRPGPGRFAGVAAIAMSRDGDLYLVDARRSVLMEFGRLCPRVDRVRARCRRGRISGTIFADVLDRTRIDVAAGGRSNTTRVRNGKGKFRLRPGPGVHDLTVVGCPRSTIQVQCR